MKVAFVIGTRPEAIKLAPLIIAGKAHPSFNTIVIDSGQHRHMSQQVFDLFGIEPDCKLDVMIPGQSLSLLTSNLHRELGRCIFDIAPDLVVVQGDTTTAMAAALEAFYHGRKVAHVEAGLRTGNIHSPFPEELNRRIIGEVADYHFAPTSKAATQLLEERKTNVYEVGNTVVDALQILNRNLEIRADKLSATFDFDVSAKKTVLVTAHRRESFGDGLRDIFHALKSLAEKYSDLQFIFPVHLNPNVRSAVNEVLTGLNNVKLIEPVNYEQLLYLLKQSLIVLTDSGGIQEEAPSFQVPVIVLRENTERPEGVDAGCAVLCGTSTELIISEFERIVNQPEVYKNMTSLTNPYGDGMACNRILNILLDKF